MYYDTGSYSAGCKEKIAVSEMNLQESSFFFVENIHSFPNISYPICHY